MGECFIRKSPPRCKKNGRRLVDHAPRPRRSEANELVWKKCEARHNPKVCSKDLLHSRVECSASIEGETIRTVFVFNKNSCVWALLQKSGDSKASAVPKCTWDNQMKNKERHKSWPHYQNQLVLKVAVARVE